MTFNSMSKLMAFMAVSFLISTNSLAQKNMEDKELDKETSAVVTAAKREVNKHGFGVGIGQTFLLGSLQNKGDSQITGDLFYSYTASYSFDLLINAHASHHAYKGKDVWLKGLAFSIKARSYEFDAFSPYVIGGLGFYQPKIAKDGVESEQKSTFGFNAGGGVDLRLNRRVVIGILGQYHNPFDVKQDETEDVKGSYFKLLLTSMYLF
ncbi:MAG: outer membrane beta-barrel protein [Bacteriovoracaceae bacterium]|nr:outer membrane beta-barrel protein [Bacteriovoracaceae bacterium]